ncbi:MAG: hypothetical protein WDO69_03785 [Pseudomonadota bacterium]
MLVLASGLVVVSVLGYRVLSKNRAALADTAVLSASPESAATATPAPTAVAEAPSLASANPATASADSAAASAESTAAASASAVEPTPAPAASASAPEPIAAPSAAAEAVSEVAIRKVTVKSHPPKARFFHFGKPVGVTPFVLELKPGERHAYEAGLPGYGTRKVVIDGSKPEITVGLQREKP